MYMLCICTCIMQYSICIIMTVLRMFYKTCIIMASFFILSQVKTERRRSREWLWSWCWIVIEIFPCFVFFKCIKCECGAEGQRLKGRRSPSHYPRCVFHKLSNTSKAVASLLSCRCFSWAAVSDSLAFWLPVSASLSRTTATVTNSQPLANMRPDFRVLMSRLFMNSLVLVLLVWHEGSYRSLLELHCTLWFIFNGDKLQTNPNSIFYSWTFPFFIEHLNHLFWTFPLTEWLLLDCQCLYWDTIAELMYKSMNAINRYHSENVHVRMPDVSSDGFESEER